ncbi:MAG: carbon-nitrogen hydrolase family protein [Sedimentisphaerales bacterium]|nr:carbon-nitrogen hydrolase family protein [Sedimentisphaerales bacterium]
MRKILPAISFIVLSTVFPATACAGSGSLISNGDFRPEPGADTPRQWSVWTPAWENAACTVRCADEGLIIQGKDPYAVGGVTQDIKGIRPGQAYAVEAACEFRNIPAPYQSVLVRVTWVKGGKFLHPAGMLVKGPFIDETKGKFKDTLIAPDDADAARISIEVKWPRGGKIIFKKIEIKPTPMPAPRKVKVGTVYLRPSGSTPEKNLQLWCEQIDAAGRLALDIVCLGETVEAVGTRASLHDRAEPVPGPTSAKLADAAKRNNIWVVATLNERAGRIVYNTGILIDRQGRIAGKYRKTHLPREEWKQGVRPGDSYPVFETDFGKVAIQICYDWFFPEPESIFALKGAEIIFAPTWGNTFPDKAGCIDGESTFRVRARDNGVYMVPSVYDGDSLIIDPMGRILADSNGKTGVFWAEIDLAKTEGLDWVGHWRSIAPRHRMPETYAPLLQNRP